MESVLRECQYAWGGDRNKHYGHKFAELQWRVGKGRQQFTKLFILNVRSPIIIHELLLWALHCEFMSVARK